jgi:hypothetical protein
MLYWIGATAIALVGVAVARILAPQLPPPYQLICELLGVTITLAGIFSLGFAARAHRSRKRNTPTPPPG